MPIRMAKDTALVLGDNARECKSRSLLLDRFADPDASEDDVEGRRNFFNKACNLEAGDARADAWQKWLDRLGEGPDRGTLRVVHAQLQSRLLVNMAGGVMENAGLCLDRFGMPYIFGSTVKGCARRTALAALQAWCTAGGTAAGKPDPAKGDLLADACAAFDDPSAMLATIARVFGWGDADWDPAGNPTTSDFAWACGAGRWTELRNAAQALLGKGENGVNRPSIPSAFAGSIAFLPAYPQKLPTTGSQPQSLTMPLPKLGSLELDIVTCHHRKYYEGIKSHPRATDDEEPNPVVFPAVAAGHLFAFPILALRTSRGSELDAAASWLACGLHAFGLGAKTNAGYGWFRSDASLQDDIRSTRLEAAKRERDRLEREAREAEDKRKEQERIERKREQDKAKASMTKEQFEDYRLNQMSDDQFRAALDKFTSLEEPKRQAIVRALRKPPEADGSRSRFWEDLKEKAKKGGRKATLADAIRAASKALYPGKEGKMP